MKKLFILPLLLVLGACASLTGNYSYIPVGPQNLSVQIEDPKNMPVYVARTEIMRPWASIGLIRIKDLPNDREVIAKEIAKIKSDAAKKGAEAVVINQYFDDNAQVRYPVSLAAYLVKFLDSVSSEDKDKIDAFAEQAAIANAGG